MNKPLVSIILPVCDAQEHLDDCIQSIKSQSYKNFEVIAVDDSSRDSSLSLLKEARKGDKRFRVYKNKNKYGLTVTLNRALKEVKGSFVAFMDPNSKNYRHRIAAELRFLMENPKYVAVGTQRKLIDKKGNILEQDFMPTEHDQIQKSLLSSLPVQPETFLINKKALPRDILKFEKEGYPYLYTNLFMKLIKYGNIANLPQFLFYYRKEQKNYHIRIDNVEKVLSYIKLWIKTTTTYEQKPSIKSIFVPLIK